MKNLVRWIADIGPRIKELEEIASHMEDLEKKIEEQDAVIRYVFSDPDYAKRAKDSGAQRFNADQTGQNIQLVNRNIELQRSLKESNAENLKLKQMLNESIRNEELLRDKVYAIRDQPTTTVWVAEDDSGCIWVGRTVDDVLQRYPDAEVFSDSYITNRDVDIYLWDVSTGDII